MEPVFVLKPREEVEKEIKGRIRIAKKIKQKKATNLDDLRALRLELGRWVQYNFDLLKLRFSDTSIANSHASFLPENSVELPPPSLSYQINEFKDIIDRLIHSLKSLLERLPLMMEKKEDKSIQDESSHKGILSRNIFVVHGRDEASKQTVARFLEHLGLNPIVLHEQPNKGRVLLKKLLDHTSDTDYAVVLLTPDDIGYLKEEPKKIEERARQNVIFELGLLIASLGESNVCSLHKGNITPPSNYAGVVYIEMDNGEGWKLKLAKEINDAGIQVDLNKALL